MKHIKLLLILSLSLQVLSAQGEVSSFDFEQDYRINPHVSFSTKESSFIICNYIYHDSEGNIRNGDIHILEFDSNKNYKSRKIIEFESSNSKEIIIKKVIKSNDFYKLLFLKEKDNGYEFFTGNLDLDNLQVTNEKLAYSIDFPKNFWNQHNRLIEDKKQIYLLSLDTKNKALLVYLLNEDEYTLKKFVLEKKVFRDLKTDFELFESSKSSNEYLDYSQRLKFHFYKDNLFLAKVRYNQTKLKASYNFPIDILKLNLKTGEHTRRVIEKFNTNEKFSSVSFSLIDDYLFYTYAFDNKVVLERLNLNTYDNSKNIILENDINSIDIKPTYSNYKKDSQKTIVEEIEFKKFYNKFKNSPVLSVMRIEDSIYQIRIGRVAYKAYSSFGNFLGTFATSTVLGTLSSYVTNQQFYYYTYSLRNDIPKIHELFFSYDDINNKILKSESKYLNQKRQIILNNLKYFINKEIVSVIGDSSEEEPNVFLYRKRGSWKKFFVYSFED